MVVAVQFKNISLIKNMALLCVVFAHCSMFFIEKNPFVVLYASEKSAFAVKAIMLISYFVIPVFMFASGFLLAKSCEKGRNNLLGLLVKRGKRLLVPYLLTGLLWLVPLYTWFDVLVYRRPAGTSLWAGYQAFLAGLFTDHLWFLLALFWVNVFFILLFPLLNRSLTTGVLFSLAAAVIIQEFLQTVPYYKLDQTALPIVSALFGILVYRGQALVEALPSGRKRLMIGGLLGLVVVLLHFDQGNVYFGWVISIAGCLLFYFCSTIFVQTKMAAQILYSRLYEWTERHSMQYYLFHMPFPYLFFRWFYPGLHISPVLFILLNLLTTIMVTTAVVLVFQKARQYESVSGFRWRSVFGRRHGKDLDNIKDDSGC